MGVKRLKPYWRRDHSFCMAALWAAVLLALVATVALAAPVGGEEENPMARSDGSVWVIPVRGTIDLGLSAYVERAVRQAADAGAVLILVELNTFGGRVDAATEIRDTLVGSGLPTAAFVGERAWSAGALIALAADTLWMAPGSSIGAAQPVPADEKTVSALRAEFEATAERTGRNPKIAAAMVDASVVIDGLVAAGEILTLTANRAVDVGYAEGVVASRLEVLAALGMTGRRVVVAELNWAERAARFLSEPTVSQLLLTLGFLGLIAEATSPGVGVPGLVGVAALALFYGARLVTGLAGWEAVLLFVAGIILVALELLVIPGTGVAGFAGVAAVLGSLFLSFGGIEEALRSIGISLGLTVIGAVILWKYGKRVGFWRRVILEARLSDQEGYVSARDYQGYVGKAGVALTALRPAGAVEIAGERIDAVSEGGYIAAGSAIEVRHVEGNRVVVRAIRETKGG